MAFQRAEDSGRRGVGLRLPIFRDWEASALPLRLCKMQGNDQPSLIENTLSGLAILDVIHILDQSTCLTNGVLELDFSGNATPGDNKPRSSRVLGGEL